MDSRRDARSGSLAPPFALNKAIAELQRGDRPLLEYLEQLEARFAEWEPRVRAFVPEEDRFQRLRREARQLLDRYPDPATRPPLFGVPLGVKDIFHAAGFATLAGSRLPAETFQGPEAAVVTALKKAGALILGKTVTTEFAYFAPGPTRNPHHLDHTPGGSSSGSAAAVAAGLCPLALGTQTIGSIIRPASFCGVVGFKPSYDRISREGVIPLSPSLDHIGFFVPEVAGARRVAALLCAEWQPELREPKPALGIPHGPYLEQATEEGLDHFHSVCDRLAQGGITVRRVPAMSDFQEIVARHNCLMSAEAAAVHEEWFARFDHLYHAKTAALLTEGEMVPEAAVQAARQGRRLLREELATLMDEYQIDLWIAPSATGPAPAGIESTGDPIMNLPWTQSGLPALNVPAGANGAGLPLGVQLVGRWYEDEALLQWAERIESVIREG